MNTLFFTHQHRRSTKTLRINYGLEGMKYIIQVYEGEINGHGEKEGLPTEYQYEFEQDMLKHVHDQKLLLIPEPSQLFLNPNLSPMFI